MADNKKMIGTITSMDEDFARWYTDMVEKAELCDYVSTKGCMAIKPAGYIIWENIQKEMDRRFKETGVQNIYMPIFISESPLEKEKDHMEEFAPEVAWATHGGLEGLQGCMRVRPTSEAPFCDFYAKDIYSYRDLPRVYSQWCSVVRWEKTTRPSSRFREFLWQESHTARASTGEAEARTTQMLNLYANLREGMLAIPVIKGRKTDKEKFAEAEVIYTIGPLMRDGKALRSGTSHNFDDGFAKASDIQLTGKDSTLKYAYQASWGMSTRIIGAIIMVHGNDSGLVLPPGIVPIQIMMVPTQQQKEGVLDEAHELKERLTRAGYAIEADDTDKSPDWKLAGYEMCGVLLRVETRPKDIEKNQTILVRRDNHEKGFVSLDELETKAGEMLDTIHDAVLGKAGGYRDAHTYTAAGWDEFVDTVNNKPSFAKIIWCGCLECEEKIKEAAGVTSRCVSSEQEKLSNQCICYGKPTKKTVYRGRAY